jgi:alpha-glucosidase
MRAAGGSDGALSPRSWWREGVFYQIYPRAFQDSNGDGVGDLPGIISRLDHLNDGTPRSLGVDAIWLSPFYRSPMADFGYDVSDYRDVDPTFGTLADFDRLLAEAHSRGIRVIVDLVPGHTSDRHPWFEAARSSRRDPMRDFYVWADPRRGGGPPNNWRAVFTRVGSAWTFDRNTGQYYLHHFLPEQPDLNWRNERVREAIDDVMRFWLDRGTDGFRVDVASGLIRDERLRDNPRFHLFGRPWRRNWDLDEVHEIHRRWRKVLDSYDGERMAVGEVSVRNLRRLARYYGHDDELQLSFNFHFLAQPWRADRFRAVVEEWEAVLPANAWPDYTLSNHDRHRATSRYGVHTAPVAAVMLLTLRGTPFIYYGEEIGMVDGRIPPDRVRDVNARDPERTPMQWDASHAAGFSTGDPWLPVASGYEKRNVAAQRDDPDSLLSLYRRLIWLRKGSRALRGGAYRTVKAPAGAYAYVREAGSERAFVALNFTRADRVVSFEDGQGRVVFATDRTREGDDQSLQRVALGPDEALILTRR